MTGSGYHGTGDFVIGGNADEECYYIRDGDIETKVDIAYIEDNPEWFVYLGTADVANERRSYFALRADLP